MTRPTVFLMALAITTACRSSAASSGASLDATPAGRTRPAGVTAAMIAAGDTIFNTRSCKNCHAVGGVGSARGPNLTDSTWIHIDGSYEQIVSLVTTGFTKGEMKDPRYRFSMNPRGGVQLTDEQIRAVAAYVWSLSNSSSRTR